MEICSILINCFQVQMNKGNRSVITEGNEFQPAPCKSPWPVRATNSAAPLKGFVTTPTSPKPTPVTRPIVDDSPDQTC